MIFVGKRKSGRTDTPDITLRLIVRERNHRIGDEAQCFILEITKPVKEISGFGLLCLASFMKSRLDLRTLFLSSGNNRSILFPIGFLRGC